jgi:NAD-dependent deacetylase
MEELIQRAARDLVDSRYAVALTGAGISTESGIPDFRGPGGIWTKDPEAEKRAYQTYEMFKENPRAHWEERLSRPSLLGNLEKMDPNPGHYALAELQKMGILKWLITQNIDNLHRRAGSKNVLEYHGNAFRLRCPSCNSRYEQEEYDFKRLHEEGKLPPLCRECGGAVKSDVVYFGEPIPSDVAQQSLEESWRCDLMLICGTSAVVFPFANLPRVARKRQVDMEGKTESGLHFVERVPAVTIIEVNAEPTPLTHEGISDYLIQGKTGQVLPRVVEEVKKIRSAG